MAKKLSLIIASMSLLVFTVGATAHSWYSFECCSDNDCKPISPDDVKTTPNGYEVTFAGDTFKVPYDDNRIKQSQDMDYHACEYPKGQLRCLYVPAGGV